MRCSQFFNIFRIYLEAGFLLFLGFLVFKGAIWTLFRLKIKLNYSHFVSIGYSLLLSAISFPLLFLALPSSTLLRPSVQVWSGSSPTVNSSSYVALSQISVNSIDSPLKEWIIPENAILIIIATVSFIAFFLMLTFVNRIFKLHRYLDSLPVLKKIGKVQILASDDCPVAFSAWLPMRAVVVIPTRHLSHVSDYLLTVCHELQHHRHGDTQWLYLIELLKYAFFWNPGIYGFSKILTQLQEFACDEFLIGRRKHSTQAYGSCLVRAAESTIGLHAKWVGTASMAAINDHSLLKRRVQMILNYQPNRPTNTVSVFFLAILLIVMTASAYAAKSSMQDKKISLEEAKRYAAVLSKNSQIPIMVNDLVLKKLNYFIGTTEGRKWIRAGLKRMPQYRQMILDRMSTYSVPEELLAIPLFESGFKNLPPTPPQRGAGIWEFIAETAQRYKLEVSDKNDERLNPVKETEAAMQYLKDLNHQFKDWRLAIKAYNEGQERVQELIDQYSTKDPWTLEHKSSPEGYLSGVMAIIIILNNPSLLN